MSYSLQRGSAAAPTHPPPASALIPGAARLRERLDAISRRLPRPELALLLAITAVLYLWSLSKNGWANDYYSATVRSSWHNFLPSVWAVDTLGHATSGTFPEGGPANAQTAGGVFGGRGGRFGAGAFGGPPPGFAPVPRSPRSAASPGARATRAPRTCGACRATRAPARKRR
jgi:hypothetical protein